MIPELKTFILSFVPFLDVKLAVPYALKAGIPSLQIFMITLLGTIIPASIYLAILGPVSRYLMAKFECINKFGTKVFHKTRTQHTKRFNRYGALGIIALVAIPVPGSGSIAGSTVAFLFNVSYKKSVLLVIIGSAISILALLTGFGSIFKILHAINPI